jgi:hypothetical protein
LATFLIAASIVMATVSIATPVLADKEDKINSRDGLDKADQNVHENTPGELTGQQDKVFHEGLCQGDLSTTVVEANGGCDGPLGLGDPGNSDENRNDD